MPAAADIREFISSLNDPALQLPFGRSKMLREVRCESDRAVVSIDLPTPAYPDAEGLKQYVISQVKSRFPDLADIHVDLNVVVQGKNSGANIGLKVKNVIAVGSGKGGVGKSTVATSLAYALKDFGARVGLMDADVYGPSIPQLTGAQGQPAIKQYETHDGRTFERIEPIEVDGLKVISMGFMIAPDQAVIWRGPMLHKALSQFLQQTDWGDLDYLIIDMPPGTGDVALTLSQMISVAGAIVVCTPQQVALLDAIKAITMFNTVKIPVLGLVENMTGEVFGRGGVRAKAAELGLPFLGEIPSQSIIRIRGDEGRMADLFTQDNPAREPIREVARNAALQLAKSLLANPSLPTFELL